MFLLNWNKKIEHGAAECSSSGINFLFSNNHDNKK